MGRRKKKKKKKRKNNPRKVSSKKRVKNGFSRIFALFKSAIFNLPGKLQRYILTSLMLLLALISFLSFFDLSGKGGKFLKDFLFWSVGDSFYIVPFIFILWGVIFLVTARRLLFVGILAGFSFLLGVAGAFSLLDSVSGGRTGDLFSRFFSEMFGDLVSSCIFFTFSVLGSLAFWHLFSLYFSIQKERETVFSQVIKKVKAFPQFKVLEVEPEERAPMIKEGAPEEILRKPETLRTEPLKFTLPPLDFLEKDKEKAHAGNVKQNNLIIQKTLEDFGIKVAMAGVSIGPTVTQYTLKPAEGVRLSKITALANNLSLALAAHPIRIEAPIPGKSLVGIEIPNKVRSRVRLRNLIESTDFKKSLSSLTFALGRDVAGEPVFGDLARLPHLLVAGATGTGKTIFLNSFILSLLYENSPETLRLILVDPKRVEFPVYNGLPHLAFPVVFDAERSVKALQWLVQEMERRFKVLSGKQAKDIVSFNKIALKDKENILPYIVLIIDELADLMASRGKEIEASVVRIAQMARAVGIHLVLATQRPSVEVITGLIKANITSRVSFQVASQFDARTVLDMAGSEKLLGLGDMLYVSAERVKPRRIQGTFVSENEVRKVVEWLKENTVPEAAEEDAIFKSFQEFGDREARNLENGREFQDSLYGEAKKVVIRARKASASLLQRRLQIGYARAARLLDMMEAEGVIGPPEGAKPRKVYFEPEDEQEGIWE